MGVSRVKVDLVDPEILSVVRRDEAVAMDQVWSYL